MSRPTRERLRCAIWLSLKFRRLVKAARRHEATAHEFSADMSRELALNRMVFDPEEDEDAP